MEKEKGFRLPCRSLFCGMRLMPDITLPDTATQHCSTVATGWISPLMCVCVYLREGDKMREGSYSKGK